jgi:hypothetical protein
MEALMEKLKKFFHRLMASALFWIFAIFSSMVGFVHLFEKFSRFSVDKIYNLF